MNKAQLINQIVEETDYSKNEVSELLNSALEIISHTLKGKNKVSLMGFGTFSVTTRPPRTAINPKTLEKVQVGARSRVKFKAGKDLVDLVNEKE